MLLTSLWYDTFVTNIMFITLSYFKIGVIAISVYLYKSCCLMKCGIQGNNCTHSFQWYWCNCDCIHLYPEHIHLYLIVHMHIIVMTLTYHCTKYDIAYPHKLYCWKKFGILGSNCTHSFQWYWCKSDCIHLYQEHIHLCLICTHSDDPYVSLYKI